MNDPEVRKRFRSFVNSVAGDNNIVFVKERDQMRPATVEEKKQAKVIPILATTE